MTSATNVWIEPGTQSPEELYADIKSGFYVTELMGMSTICVAILFGAYLVMSQETYLFHASIAENLRALSRSEESLWGLLRCAQAVRMRSTSSVSNNHGIDLGCIEALSLQKRQCNLLDASSVPADERCCE